MTANNLIAFFEALPKEEQNKFMELAEKSIKPKKTKLKLNKRPVLTQAEALRYLTTKVFK